MPLIWGVCLTALDVLIVLYLQHKGFRYVEALVIALIVLIAGSFASSCWLAQPEPVGVVAAASSRAPRSSQPGDALHRHRHPRRDGDAAQPVPALVDRADAQVRATTPNGKREAIRFATIDSSVALMSALFINAAILVMAAATFHGTGYDDVADIGDAYKLLSPLLGTTMASTLFAVALLCSGQNATLTGTLAGQIVMEGFINLRLRPWLRRLITRLIAIIPAVIVHHHLRRERHGAAAHPQPGDPEPAAAVRGVPARDVHERPDEDGRVRQPGVGESRWRGRSPSSSRR